MKEYKDIINSRDVLSVAEGKLTAEQLKINTLNTFHRFCRDEAEKIEAEEYVEKGFTFIYPLLKDLTIDEYRAVAEYGYKIGTTSYDINYLLRNNKPLYGKYKDSVHAIDNVMDRFSLLEETVVYRALKPDYLKGQKPEDLIGQIITDNGYMSSSLFKEYSYAYFKDYEIVLEITLPVGTKCLYLEWFKGSDDEKEMLIARGTSIAINNARKEIINGHEKIVFSCSVIPKSLKNEEHLGL